MNELQRGRLIDHLQIVVADLEKSKKFYKAIFSALSIPIGGENEEYFWADEFFVSSKNVEAVFHGPAKKSAESIKITF